MDKKKQNRVKRMQEKQQKEMQDNPAYQYMNNMTLDFPKRYLKDTLADHGKVDNALEKIHIELSIIEEQRLLQQKTKEDIEAGKTEQMTPDGRRIMTKSELLTQLRICDVTIWQSKINVEKHIEDMIKFVGIRPDPTSDKIILTQEEHSAVAMDAIARAERSGVQLFASNKERLMALIKG